MYVLLMLLFVPKIMVGVEKECSSTTIRNYSHHFCYNTTHVRPPEDGTECETRRVRWRYNSEDKVRNPTRESSFKRWFCTLVRTEMRVRNKSPKMFQTRVVMEDDRRTRLLFGSHGEPNRLYLLNTETQETPTEGETSRSSKDVPHRFPTYEI